MESNKTAEEIAKKEAISLSSLNRWKKEFKGKIADEANVSRSSRTWTSRDKFRVVVETLSVNELEIGEYCRKNGLYREQIWEWKESSLGANAKKIHKIMD